MRLFSSPFFFLTQYGTHLQTDSPRVMSHMGRSVGSGDAKSAAGPGGPGDVMMCLPGFFGA